MQPVDIYLDHAASSTLRTEAMEAAEPWLVGWAANASGAHHRARAARRAVEEARDTLADVLGVGRNEIVFTSGGTEADDLAITGHLTRRPGPAVCSAIEHPAVSEPLVAAGGLLVSVDRNGLVDIDHLADSIGPDTSLVSIMCVNNEVGTIQPLAAVAELVRERSPDAALHTDAVQALSWVDLRPVCRMVDLVSLSAHKFGGPTGVGACIIRNRVDVAPRQRGGGQEQERRGGTLNVAGIVGMAAAAAVTDAERLPEIERIGALRDHFVDAVVTTVPHVVPTVPHPLGTDVAVVAGTAHLCFVGHESEEILFLLDEAGVCASAASACASGAQQRSHVLAAMGVDPDAARGAVRFSFGYDTTRGDIDSAIGIVADTIARLSGRSSPLGAP